MQQNLSIKTSKSLKSVMRIGGSAICLVMAALPGTAFAQSEDMALLLERMAAQEERIARLEALAMSQAATIDQLRGQSIQTAQQSTLPAPAQAANTTSRTATTGAATQVVAASAPIASPPPAQPAAEDPRNEAFIAGLDIKGDARVRQEFNVSDDDRPDRARTVIRARIGATYEATPELTFGARLVTGNADDPQSADVTLGDFVNDVPIALDRLYLQYQTGAVTAYAGKFPLLFDYTPIVWDSDVNLEGFGLVLEAPLSGPLELDVAGTYFLLDESSGGADSYMLGVQGHAALRAAEGVKAELAVAYYDYALRDLGSAGSGDFRSNLRAPSGEYLSQFRLLDVIGQVTFEGLGDKWPVRLRGNYVHNYGAAVDGDTGFELSARIGRAKKKSDWRFAYNYSEVEVDAVFAALSDASYTIATNYALHGLTAEHMLADNLNFQVNWYHYRPLDAQYAGSNTPTDWLDRLRVNLQVKF